MPLPSDAERDALRRRATLWLKQKWTQPKNCPICDSTSWSVETIQQWNEYSGDYALNAGTQLVSPVVPVSCNVCGYTFAINAIIAKLVDGTDQGLDAGALDD